MGRRCSCTDGFRIGIAVGPFQAHPSCRQSRRWSAVTCGIRRERCLVLRSPQRRLDRDCCGCVDQRRCSPSSTILISLSLITRTRLLGPRFLGSWRQLRSDRRSLRDLSANYSARVTGSFRTSCAGSTLLTRAGPVTPGHFHARVAAGWRAAPDNSRSG